MYIKIFQGLLNNTLKKESPVDVLFNDEEDISGRDDVFPITYLLIFFTSYFYAKLYMS